MCGRDWSSDVCSSDLRPGHKMAGALDKVDARAGNLLDRVGAVRHGYGGDRKSVV